MHPIKKWHELVKSGESDQLDDLLDDNIIFFSPVVFTPQKGKKTAKIYLTAAGRVLGESNALRYVKEIIGENSAVLEFESEVDGIHINGIDLISWNQNGKITEFKVMVRPLQAVNKLHQEMQRMMMKDHSALSWLKKIFKKG